ncbi:MAG: DUF1669 domain-containing protein [Nanoarchaeota archaeon]|nr:DUF1669 domain-containing protein [Nanoarchaeota archaeon]MBU1644387.1 DUF1669 domain-containing protein [Nanoarchaeota archaeon]MBU1976426.1 DUF1669 domain-containing protein [Nanoarchaeota archaeon]
MKKITFSFLLLTLLFLNLKLSAGLEEPKEINYYLSDFGSLDLYFCPREDCETALVNFIGSAQESVHCALFDIGLTSVQQKLDEKAEKIDVKVVTDKDYFKKYSRNFVKTDSFGLMHNKFCIIDGKKVSTGSMNPTENGADKNNNNLLLIDSKVLAQNYEDEFQELWQGIFKKGNEVSTPSLEINRTKLKVYFCPEDHCAYQVKKELKKAEKSIYFLTFSFTNQEIANTILLKNLEGLAVKGVMEARQISKYSRYQQFLNNGIEVVKDKNKNNMHHKVFIIDNSTVITGSFNPTQGGDENNDENVLIIKDEIIAKKFLEEFNDLFQTED